MHEASDEWQISSSYEDNDVRWRPSEGVALSSAYVMGHDVLLKYRSRYTSARFLDVTLPHGRPSEEINTPPGDFAP